MKNSIAFLFGLSIWSAAMGQSQLGQTLSGSAAGERFGADIAISNDGTRIAIVAGDNGTQGALSSTVEVYDRNGNTWSQVGNASFAITGQTTQQLNPAVDLSDDGKTLAIGNPSFSAGGASNVGQVELFEDVSSTGNWVKKGTTLVGPSPEGEYGRQVKVITEGTQFSTGVFRGDADAERGLYAYIFENGDWAPRGTQPVLQAFRETEVHAVSSGSTGGRVAVTYSQNNAGQSFQIHQYLIPTASWIVQVQKQSPVPEVGYGEAIALANIGFTSAVGAPREGTGVVRVYNDDGDLLGAEISDSQTANFGQKVALAETGTRLVVGATGNATTPGKVVVYDFVNGTWTPIFSIIADQLNDQTGLALDISSNGNFLAIASPNKGSQSQGEVRVFDLSGNSNVKTAKEANLTFSPNPTRDFLHISGLQQAGAQAFVYNSAGKIVQSEKLSGQSLDVSTLPTGTYTLLLNLQDGPVSMSFLKE